MRTQTSTCGCLAVQQSGRTLLLTAGLMDGTAGGSCMDRRGVETQYVLLSGIQEELSVLVCLARIELVCRDVQWQGL
jgi:hypothetical protein